MRFEPFERERRFVTSLNLGFIQRALWPLLAVFIALSILDLVSTSVAAESGMGFVELNRYVSTFFARGYQGFMFAYLLKVVPILPLGYMVAVRTEDPGQDFQVRLLKFAALVVLVSLDIYLGVVVLGNNIPQLLGYPRV